MDIKRRMSMTTGTVVLDIGWDGACLAKAVGKLMLGVPPGACPYGEVSPWNEGEKESVMDAVSKPGV